jgi:hypothetical protein
MIFLKSLLLALLVGYNLQYRASPYLLIYVLLVFVDVTQYNVFFIFCFEGYAPHPLSFFWKKKIKKFHIFKGKSLKPVQ